MEHIIPIVFFLGCLIYVLYDAKTPLKLKQRKYRNNTRKLSTNGGFIFDNNTREIDEIDYGDIIDLSSSNNMFISHEEKVKYLKSEKWRQLKSKIVKNHPVCQNPICNNKATEVHHIHYRNLTNENPEDLVALCRYCHQKIHDKLGYDRTKEYPIEILTRGGKK